MGLENFIHRSINSLSPSYQMPALRKQSDLAFEKAYPQHIVRPLDESADVKQKARRYSIEKSCAILCRRAHLPLRKFLRVSADRLENIAKFTSVGSLASIKPHAVAEPRPLSTANFIYFRPQPEQIARQYGDMISIAAVPPCEVGLHLSNVDQNSLKLRLELNIYVERGQVIGQDRLQLRCGLGSHDSHLTPDRSDRHPAYRCGARDPNQCLPVLQDTQNAPSGSIAHKGASYSKPRTQYRRQQHRCDRRQAGEIVSLHLRNLPRLLLFVEGVSKLKPITLHSQQEIKAS